MKPPQSLCPSCERRVEGPSGCCTPFGTMLAVIKAAREGKPQAPVCIEKCRDYRKEEPDDRR